MYPPLIDYHLEPGMIQNVAPATVIGIDPGKNGALAVLGLNGAVFETRPMPLIAGAKKSRPEYDIRSITNYLKGYRADCCLVMVERSQPLSMIRNPKGRPGPDAFKPGSIAQFNRGVQRGFEWLLTALEIPFQLVAPRSWMKVMHAGAPGDDTKQRSVIAAQRLFPGVDLRRTPRCRKADHGIAEALLLAEFGRRTRNGGVK